VIIVCRILTCYHCVYFHYNWSWRREGGDTIRVVSLFFYALVQFIAIVVINY